jgi:hypothetical protein
MTRIDAAVAAKEIDAATLEKWRGGKAPERAAAIIYEKYAKGREPGTALPFQRELEYATGFSSSTVTEAKGLLGDDEYGVLKKSGRYWVVA